MTHALDLREGSPLREAYMEELNAETMNHRNIKRGLDSEFSQLSNEFRRAKGDQKLSIETAIENVTMRIQDENTRHIQAMDSIHAKYVTPPTQTEIKAIKRMVSLQAAMAQNDLPRGGSSGFVREAADGRFASGA